MYLRVRTDASERTSRFVFRRLGVPAQSPRRLSSKS